LATTAAFYMRTGRIRKTATPLQHIFPSWPNSAIQLVAAAAVVCAALLGTGLAALPVEAPLFRSVEVKRKRPLKDGEQLPKWYGKHPCPEEPEEIMTKIPGEVESETQREADLRKKLRYKELVTNEEFEKLVEVFSSRARSELKWMPVQRRHFLKRAKRWAGEMVLQDREPSQITVRRLLLACAANGDVSGAEWWMRWMQKNNRPIKRLEYDALIGAYGEEGLPRGARGWLERMVQAGFAPDARSYAGVIQAWEKLGNRKRMLTVLQEMRDAETQGHLGKPLDPRDAALPYLAAARSYADVADAPRALAILKHLQAREIPLTYEAHLLRLEVHVRTPPGPRQSLTEIERALRDVILERPLGKAVLSSALCDMCRYTLGEENYLRILQELGVQQKEISVTPIGADLADQWRRSRLARAMEDEDTGRQVLMRKNEDDKWFKGRLEARQGAVMGEIETGYRIPAEQGLPEWMTLPLPERYGY